MLKLSLSKKPSTYLIGMCSVLMFGSVRGIAEGFGAAGELAGVGFFSGVRSQVGLQVLEARVSLVAILELKKRQRLNSDWIASVSLTFGASLALIQLVAKLS